MTFASGEGAFCLLGEGGGAAEPRPPLAPSCRQPCTGLFQAAVVCSRSLQSRDEGGVPLSGELFLGSGAFSLWLDVLTVLKKSHTWRPGGRKGTQKLLVPADE